MKLHLRWFYVPVLLVIAALGAYWSTWSPSGAPKSLSQSSNEGGGQTDESGVFEIQSGDDPVHHLSDIKYFLNTGKERLLLNLERESTLTLKGGEHVRLKQGMQLERVDSAESAGSSHLHPQTESAQGNLGVKKGLIIRMINQNKAATLSDETIKARFFSETNPQSIATYYRTVTFDQVRLQGTVVGSFVGPTCFDGVPGGSNSTVLNAALAALDDYNRNNSSNAVHVANFDRLVILSDSDQGCQDPKSGSSWNWASMGNNLLKTVDGNVEMPVLWAYAYSDEHVFLNVLAHEMGHNFGLYHASGVTCTANSVFDPSCVPYEYTDYYDVMGWGTGHLSAFHKQLAGWLQGQTAELPPGNFSTDVTLRALESQASNQDVQQIKIPINLVPSKTRSTEDLTHISVEFRAPMNFDSNIQSSLFVRYVGNTFSNTNLFSGSTYFSILTQANPIFVDEKNGIRITLLSIVGDTARVHIERTFDPSQNPFNLQMTPADQLSKAGFCDTLHVTVGSSLPDKTLKISYMIGPTGSLCNTSTFSGTFSCDFERLDHTAQPHFTIVQGSMVYNTVYGPWNCLNERVLIKSLSTKPAQDNCNNIVVQLNMSALPVGDFVLVTATNSTTINPASLQKFSCYAQGQADGSASCQLTGLNSKNNYFLEISYRSNSLTTTSFSPWTCSARRRSVHH